MEKQFKGKKVGIWGFGTTGQSILRFLSLQQAQCMVLDDGTLSSEQTDLIAQTGALVVDTPYKQQFFKANELIIPSPGITTSPWQEKYHEKFLSELDLFARFVTTPVIAITGSAGKTSTVTLLTQALNAYGKKARFGGNIGIPLLDLIATQTDYDFLILELSSFQLEHSNALVPHYAAVINIFENHLDRHQDMHTYIAAKAHIFMQQNSTCHAFIPMEYADHFLPFITEQKLNLIAPTAYANITKALSDIMCHNNWQIICAILETLDLDLEKLPTYAHHFKKPEHRLEYVTTQNNIHFYNDSKATMPAATLQAVTQLHDHTLIVLLGGLSKGVNRSPLIQELALQKQVKHIICFGAEAVQLADFCKQHVVPHTACATLQEAYHVALQLACSGDTILLSPAGSSFDAFKNYQERGTYFKQLCEKP